MKNKSAKPKNIKDKHQQPLSALEEAFFEQASAALRKSGLKHTPIRESLLQFLIRNHGPFSNEEIQKALPNVDMDNVTLYRNLSSFEKIGLIRRSEFGDGVSRYEFQPHPDHHHHHVLCIQCRKVESLEICEMQKIETLVKKLGYSKIKHSLEFYGVCKSCSKKQNDS